MSGVFVRREAEGGHFPCITSNIVVCVSTPTYDLNGTVRYVFASLLVTSIFRVVF